MHGAGSSLGQSWPKTKDYSEPMRTAADVARKSNTKPGDMPNKASDLLAGQVAGWLDDAKAEAIITIDISQKSSIGDYMIIATGRTDRHVGAVAEQLREKLKEAGYARVRVEGQPQCDWVLVDAGDVIVHILRQEVREFYNLEKMWLADRPNDVAH
jgi:ribosome-associated protein